MKKLFKNKAFISFLLSLLLGMLIVLPSAFMNKGIFSLVADYNLQQVPFGMLMNDAIKNGNFFWTWFNDLGSNFIGTFSFYNLCSPFSLISYLFPSSFYPYLSGILLIFKYGISGLTSYLFFKRYVKNKDLAIIGSLLYSFSGFQLTNMLFHFHDIVVLFPLILYTLDNLVYDNKRYYFLLTVTLLSLTNWFLFIGEVIFVLLYFIVKVITKEYKINKNIFFTICFESIVGVMLASFILVPTFLFILSNPRLGNSFDLLSSLKYPNFGTYVELLRSFIFPPETMAYRSFLTEQNYNSVEIYLPVVGSLFVIGYYLKNYKRWESILFISCLVFMLIPILNSSFFLFNGTYYARWFYMPILLMVLMTIKLLDDKKINLKKSLLFNLLLYIVFGISIFIYISRANTNNIIFNNIYFYLSVIISIICLFGSYFIYKIKNINKMIFILIISIFSYVTIWGNYIIYTYRGNNFSVDQEYLNYLNFSNYFDIEDNVRTNSSKSCLANIGVISSINNIKSFNSNINGSSFRFYNSVGNWRTVSTDIDNKLLNDFLGVKYYISCGEALNEYKLLDEYNSYKLYLNEDSKDIGFILDEYISLDEFNLLDYDERISVLNNSVVLNNQQIKKYSNVFNNNVDYDLEFKFTNNGFSSIVDSSDDAFLVFTIPYDEGWDCFINGEKVSIEDVDNGLIGIKIKKGKNNIVFSYKTPGLRVGFYIFILGLVLFYSYYSYLKK